MSDEQFKKVNQNFQIVAKDISEMKRAIRDSTLGERPGNFTQGSVLFASSSGYPTEDNANFSWDGTLDKLVLGGSNQSTALRFESLSQSTNAGSLEVAHYLNNIFNPGATQLTQVKYGIYMETAVDGSGGANSSHALLGMRSDVRMRQTAGTYAGPIYAFDAVFRHSGAGNAADARGVRSIYILSSTGNLTSFYNFLADTPSVSGGGAITTAYGFRVNKQKVTGVTTGYGFYQADAADINFFAGTTTVANGIVTDGALAGFSFNDRTTATSWEWYGNTTARLFNGAADVLTITTAGAFNLIGAGRAIQMNGTQVLGNRITGWGTPTGTLNRAALTNASTQLQTNQAVMAIINDLIAHGIIGA